MALLLAPRPPPLPRRYTAEIEADQQDIDQADYRLLGAIGSGGRGEILLAQQILGLNAVSLINKRQLKFSGP